MHSPFLNQLFLSHKLGLGGPIGSGQQWISWIYINDAVDLITFILNPDTKLPNGPINVCSPNPVRQSTFSVSLSEAVGAPFSGRFRVPALLVYLMLGKDRASMALEGHRAFPTKALAAGFHFRYPLIEDALEAVYGRRPRSVSTT
ncbi:unnamed protein product [Protopolystoma xenopodis]|uniref:DUF1731 domain-containing protein n=1 Tax=Protopolystoma xenopodis TaxID=117903 RepID=A0A3S5BU24_9PLAT|nr:unnamed protein product [Protopolystoma xenopodis]